MTQKLAEQQQCTREATQVLTQESVEAYMDYLDSAFSYWQGGIQAAKKGEKKSR